MIEAGNRGQISEFGGDLSDILWAAGAVTAAVATVLAYVFVYEGSDRQGGLLLSAALGGTVGWVLGVLATPYNPTEAARLGGVSKLIYAAISGYILAKVDPLFALVLGSQSAPGVKVELLPHVAIALIIMCATAMLTYVTRTYASDDRRSKSDCTKPEDARPAV